MKKTNPTHRPVWKRQFVIILTSLILAVTVSVSAEVRRPFATRFETNATGDIFLVGNASLRADPSDPDAANAQNGIGARINNNNFNMVNVDVDANGTTFNSSSADFTIPAGGEVLWAGLYWGADTENAAGSNPPDMSKRNQVLFSTGSGYQTITSAIPLDTDATGIRYQGFSQVTNLVRQQAAGSTRTYTVANIQAVTGTGPSHYAGWSLVIVLQDPAESLRHLHVFDGFAVVTGTGTVNTNVSGFRTPPSGTFATHVGMVAYEGDLGTTGDFFQVNGSTISSPLNPANNFFNSSITRLGSQITDKTPNYVNQLGFDTNTVDIPYASGIIANGAISANLTFSTNGDWYYPGVLTFSADIYMPVIEDNVIKTMTDINGGALHPGDLINFTISVTNTGNDNAIDVVLRDAIPAYTTYVPGSLQVVSGANAGSKSDSIGNDQAEFIPGNNEVVFRLGTGADGTNGGTLVYTESTVVSFRIQVNSGIPSGVSIENTAVVDYVAFTTGEAVTASSNTISIAYPENADLALTKTVDQTVRNEGETAVYTITVTNNGPWDATGVQIADNLPDGVLFQSSLPSQGNYDNGSGVWNVGNVADGSDATLDITVTVAAGAGGLTQPITNTASVAALGQIDQNSTNNTDSADIFVAPVADLFLEKTVDKATPDEGETIIYTITLTNNGEADGTNITVTDQLPAGVTYVSDTPGQGSYNSGTGIWTVDDLANGAVVTLSISATVDAGTAGTAISNTATVTSGNPVDPDTTNNSDSADILIAGADLEVSKTVDNGTPNEGEAITYTVTVTNNGAKDATSIAVTDSLPAGVTYVSNTTSQGGYDSGSGIWTVGDLANGAGATLSITATVDGGTSGTTITNTAAVTAVDQADPDSSNNSDSVNIVPGSADLAVSKTVNNPTPGERAAITYTVTVTNTGPGAATNVTLTDSLPAGVSYVSSTRSQGSYNSSTGIWTVGNLANGANATLSITATVDTGTGGSTITNTADNLDADQTDANAANNQDSVNITVTAPPPGTPLLDINKASDGAGSVYQGDTLTYTINVTNTGTVGLTGISVTDSLPAGTAYVTNSTEVTAPAIETVRDEFPAISYSGNNGTANWSNSWQETGESDGAGSGRVRVVFSSYAASGRALRIGGNNVDIENRGVSRQANLSGATSATLTFSYRRQRIDDPGGKIVLEVSGNGGSSWAELDNWNLSSTDSSQQSASYNISGYIGANTRVRFIGKGTAGEGGTYFYADNIQIEYRAGTATSPGGPPPGLASGYSLNAGEHLTVTFQVTVNTPFDDPEWTVDNIAAADSDQTGSKNSNAVADSVGGADLGVAKTVDKPQPGEGETITYSITVTNNGPQTATNISVTDQLPVGVTYVSDIPGQGSYNSGSGIWAVGNLDNGASATLTLAATVDAGTAGSSINNTATATDLDQVDTDPGNNSGSADILVGGADLGVMKAVDENNPGEGDTISYTITLTNNSLKTVTNIAVTDQLPSGLTYVSDTPSQGSYDSGTGVWGLANLAPGAEATLSISATMDTGTGGTTITNTATITAMDQIDPVSTNDSDSVDITVKSVDLAVSKTVNNATPGERAAITYTVTVTNNGPGAATNVTLTDSLPAGVSYVSSTRSQGTYNSSTGLWTVGDLANGAGATLNITATVDAGTGGSTITNTADNLSADQTDPNAADNQASVNITVTASPPGTPLLDINKASDGAGTVVPGATLTYTINVTNTGTVGLTGISVTDSLPAGTAYVASSTEVTVPTGNTLRDEFPAISYSGNNGTANWSNSWQETGESDGAGSGRVRVVSSSYAASGNALRIGGNNVDIENRGASRQADLSGAAAATLTFNYRRQRIDKSGGKVIVEVSGNGGSSWAELDNWNLSSTDSSQQSASYNISGYIGANTRVRFIGKGTTGDGGTYFYADNIQIEYTAGTATSPGGPPPGLASGYSLNAGEHMTVTFQVTVNTPFDDPDWTVDNIAAADSDQTGSKNSNPVVDQVDPLDPDILLVKSVQTFSDPLNSESSPKAIPGAVMLYTVAATNQGDGTNDADTVFITDSIPANTALFVGDIDGPGPGVGPVLFVDGTPPDDSGLSYTFTSLGNLSDDVAFSNDGGATYSYIPVPVDEFDSNITHLRVNPKGTFKGVSGPNTPGFQIKFKVMVE